MRTAVILATFLSTLLTSTAEAKIVVTISRDCQRTPSNPCPSGGGLPPAPQPPDPDAGCYPCVGTCLDSGGGKVCLGPMAPDGDLPLSARDAEAAGYSCVDVSASEVERVDCGIYSWTCSETICEDSTGMLWLVSSAPDPGPAEIIETLAIGLQTEDLPNCTWKDHAWKDGTASCDLICDNVWLAACARLATGTVTCADNNGNSAAGNGTMPCEAAA